MILRIYDELFFDSEVFKEINIYLILNKGKYYGIISCSDDYLKRVLWNNDKIKEYIGIKSSLVNIFEIRKFIESILKLKENILYLLYFECDRRCFNGDRGELRIEDKNYIDEILNEFSNKENIEKLWGSKVSFLFFFFYKMFKFVYEIRYFKWMMRNSEEYYYKLYGIIFIEILINLMSFISKK